MPRMVRFAVDLQPPTAEAVRNFAEASGRPVNDVMVAALEVGLGRVMGDFNRQKREAAKVAVRVHNARMAAEIEAERKARAEARVAAEQKARAEAQHKAALARFAAPPDDDDGGSL